MKWIEIENEIEGEVRIRDKGYGKIAYALLKLFILSKDGNSYTIEADFGVTDKGEASKHLFKLCRSLIYHLRILKLFIS